MPGVKEFKLDITIFIFGFKNEAFLLENANITKQSIVSDDNHWNISQLANQTYFNCSRVIYIIQNYQIAIREDIGFALNELVKWLNQEIPFNIWIK
jgi:hypothetical protein